MTDTNNNSDFVIEITDNAEAGLKEEDELQKKYFNGGKVVLTKINVENIKKKSNVVKRPLVSLFFIITIYSMNLFFRESGN
jgi:hypothetical protein